MNRLRLLKSFCHVLQVLPDGQMLGAHLLALAAFDAVAGLAVFQGQALVIAAMDGALVLVDEHFVVVQGEILGDGDVLRTVYLTVMSTE